MIDWWPDTLMNALPVGLIVVDGEGTVLEANRTAALLTGVPIPKIVGKSFFREFGFIENIDEAERALRDPTRNPRERISLSARFDAQPPVGPVIAEIVCAMFERDSKRYGAIVIQETGPAMEAVQQELERIRQTARHDINNILMGIIGHAELLLIGPDLPAGAKGKAEAIMEHSVRLREEIASLGDRSTKRDRWTLGPESPSAHAKEVVDDL